MSGQQLELEQIARFRNDALPTPDGLHWNTPELHRNVLAGIHEADRMSDLLSVGIDAWGVDYGLLLEGELTNLPFHYRDQQRGRAVASLRRRISDGELYSRTGIQHMDINTVVQLQDDRDRGRLTTVDKLLLIPDLFGYWLTGEYFAERTIASTTALVNPTSGAWDAEVLGRLGYPASLFGRLVEPGEPIAPIASRLGLRNNVTLTTVGSHDTASAVVGTPASEGDFAYISCGTWGLVGAEVERPILTEKSRLAGFTNEAGVDGRFLLQTNAMGLWLLSETVREWESDGSKIDLHALLTAAAATAEPTSLFDVEDPLFSEPGSMGTRIAVWLADHGLQVPATRAAFTRSIVESLAARYARAVRELRDVGGRKTSVIHVVGGGSQNGLLCQAIANHSGIRVLAGPSEATALGNILVQARTAGLLTGSIDALRGSARASFPPRKFEPRTARSTASTNSGVRWAT